MRGWLSQAHRLTMALVPVPKARARGQFRQSHLLEHAISSTLGKQTTGLKPLAARMLDTKLLLQTISEGNGCQAVLGQRLR